MKRERLSDSAELIEGDALDGLKAIPDGCADAFITDPPYCSGAATEAGRGSATHQGLRSETMKSGRFEWFASDNMTTSGLVWMLRAVAVEADRLLKPSGSLLVFCDWRMAFTLGPAMESAGFRMRNLLFWNKGHFGCGTGFRPQHEVILHLTRRAPEFHAMDTGNVINLDVKRVAAGAKEHPTEKPVELFQKLLRVVTPVGGLAIDPFAGSGPLREASALEGRKCILIEKDANYCNVIRRRSEAFEGRHPGSILASPACDPAPDLFAVGD